jgi:translation initiation factor IF-3
MPRRCAPSGPFRIAPNHGPEVQQRGGEIARRRPRPEPKREPKQRINEDIRSPQVRLIDSKGEQIGVVSLREALNAARAEGMDLVEVAPLGRPPVCKVLDFGKWQYEQQKKEQEARKAQKQVEMKEVRLRPKTDEHDAEVKIKRARKFLEDGHKVKFRVQFRGREITHPEIAMELLKDVANRLGEVGEVEVRPNMEGRSMFMLLTPSANPSKPESS